MMVPVPGSRTHRLDWEDPSLREWDAVVLWSEPGNPEGGIVLDRSAFYPGGGGQPPDEGVHCIVLFGTRRRRSGRSAPSMATAGAGGSNLRMALSSVRQVARPAAGNLSQPWAARCWRPRRDTVVSRY
jgi:hypothetical protein